MWCIILCLEHIKMSSKQEAKELELLWRKHTIYWAAEKLLGLSILRWYRYSALRSRGQVLSSGMGRPSDHRRLKAHYPSFFLSFNLTSLFSFSSSLLSFQFATQLSIPLIKLIYNADYISWLQPAVPPHHLFLVECPKLFSLLVLKIN